MFLEASTIEAMLVVGGVGAVGGLIGGFAAGANNLFGTILMGVIGGIAASAILRIGGAPSIYSTGDDFSLVWAAAGGLLLGCRSNV